MKIALLGATGPTGLCVVKQALDAGHHVVALVRNPSKLDPDHTRLTVCIILLKPNTHIPYFLVTVVTITAP